MPPAAKPFDPLADVQQELADQLCAAIHVLAGWRRQHLPRSGGITLKAVDVSVHPTRLDGLAGCVLHGMVAFRWHPWRPRSRRQAARQRLRDHLHGLMVAGCEIVEVRTLATTRDEFGHCHLEGFVALYSEAPYAMPD